jgi:hypothetical protein
MMFVRADREQEAPDWLLLNTWGTARLFVGTAARQQTLLGLVRSVAHRCGPTAGGVFPAVGAYSTPLEQRTKRRLPRNVEESRTFVRGYSWLTIIAEEIGQRLGGVSALRDTGAFHDVTHLDRGGYWLLATPSYAEYGLTEANAVYSALRSVLPPGAQPPTADDLPPDPDQPLPAIG